MLTKRRKSSYINNNFKWIIKQKMVPLVIAFILIVGGNGLCSYKHGVNRSLTLHEPVSRNSSPLFGLLAPNDPTLDTLDKCITYCDGQPWCFAVSEGPGPTPCQFHTDLSALGFGVPGHYDCKHDINFNCEFNGGVILDLADKVFMMNSFGDVGSGRNDILIPTDIGGDTGTCRVLKTLRNENGVPTNGTFSYSNYYGTKPVTPKAWAFHFGDSDSGASDSDTEGNPGWFADNGVNRASYGFPIRSVALWEVEINEGVSYKSIDSEHFTYFRHEYIHTAQCIDKSPPSKSYVEREVVKSDDTYFYIKTADKFFNCRLDRDEHGNGCTWDDTPSVVWSFGEFVARANNVQDQRFGAENTLIAHHVDTKREIGWLRTDIPDTGNGARFSTIGLDAAGGAGPNTPYQGPQGGTGTWNFFINPNLNGTDETDEATPSMPGTSLCYTMKFVDTKEKFVMFCVRRQAPDTNSIADAAWINADTTLMGDIVPNRTDALLHSENTGYSYFRNFGVEDKPNGIDTVVPVNVNDNFDGHLYAIFSHTDKALRLKCVVSEKCTWVKASDTTQLFKFSTNGQTPSSDPRAKFDFTKFIPSRRMEVSVYDKEGAFYVQLGTLAFSETLGVALLPFTKITADVGLKKHEGTMCGLGGNGVFCLEGGPQYKEGDEVKFVNDPNIIADMPGFPPVVGNAVFEPQVDSLTVSDDNYQWVLDGTGKCPEGYYLHQVRCTDHKKCGHVEVGCKKDSVSCRINNIENGTVVDMGHSVFKACPPNHAVTAIDPVTRTITCHPLDISVDPHPPSDRFPTFTNLGTLLVVAPFTFDSETARTKKQWEGPSPLKSLNVFNNISPILYGRKCSLNSAESNAFKNPGAPFRRLEVSADPSDPPFSCDNNNGFVSFVRCLERDNCAKGIEFFCDEAPKCRYEGGDKITITDQEFCPFGTVITGVSCVNQAGTTKPCAKLKFECRKLVFDATKPTPPPQSPDDNGKGTTKTIIIVLATGLPLLIVGAIICLFCIPDVDDTAVNRVRNVRETTETTAPVSTIERTPHGVRRRREIGRKNIF